MTVARRIRPGQKRSGRALVAKYRASLAIVASTDGCCFAQMMCLDQMIFKPGWRRRCMSQRTLSCMPRPLVARHLVMTPSLRHGLDERTEEHSFQAGRKALTFSSDH